LPVEFVHGQDKHLRFSPGNRENGKTISNLCSIVLWNNENVFDAVLSLSFYVIIRHENGKYLKIIEP
jgi:hypothetical protein